MGRRTNVLGPQRNTNVAPDFQKLVAEHVKVIVRFRGAVMH